MAGPGKDPNAVSESADAPSDQPWGAGARRGRRAATGLWAAAAAVVLVLAAAAGAWLAFDRAILAPERETAAAEAARFDRALAALGARADRFEAELARRDAAGRSQDPALEARLAGLAERIAALEAAEARPDALAGRMEALEARLAAGRDPATDEAAAGAAAEREARRDAALRALTATVAALEARLERLRRGAAPSAGREGAMLLAIGQLRAALDRGRPFQRELEALRRIRGADGAADPIAALAPAGIPTEAALVREFPARAAEAARAAFADGDGGWIDRSWARLSRLVTVRRVGADAPGDGASAVLARAEALLEAGDLAGAAAALAPLDGAPAEAMAAWRAGALARAAAETALARLAEAALAESGG